MVARQTPKRRAASWGLISVEALSATARRLGVSAELGSKGAAKFSGPVGRSETLGASPFDLSPRFATEQDSRIRSVSAAGSHSEAEGHWFESSSARHLRPL
jgi:hypothetical protein